jgi:hypothetical protein
VDLGEAFAYSQLSLEAWLEKSLLAFALGSMALVAV